MKKIVLILFLLWLAWVVINYFRKRGKKNKKVKTEKPPPKNPFEVIKEEQHDNAQLIHYGSGNVFVAGIDKFEKAEIYHAHHIKGEYNEHFCLYNDNGDTLFLGFKKVNEHLLLSFLCYQKEMKPKKGDEIKLLLNNDDVLSYTLDKNADRKDKDHEGVIIGLFQEIDLLTLEKIEEIGIDSIRIYLNKEGGNETFTLSQDQKKNLPLVVKNFIHFLKHYRQTAVQ